MNTSLHYHNWVCLNSEGLNTSLYEDLRSLYLHFGQEDTSAIKEIEKTTNHDVKAVEYFIKKEFDALGLERYKEFIHFGLTSQDVNNTAIPLSIKAVKESISQLEALQEQMVGLAEEYKDIPMLARTHGQPASPYQQEEIEVFVNRLEEQKIHLLQVPHAARIWRSNR